MHLLVCPFCHQRTRVRQARIGAHTCCPRCDEKFVLDASSLQADPLEELEHLPDGEGEASAATEAMEKRLQDLKARRPDRPDPEQDMPTLPPLKPARKGFLG